MLSKSESVWCFTFYIIVALLSYHFRYEISECVFNLIVFLTNLAYKA